MAINLQKGQTINLRKESTKLSEVTIGLGWDVRTPAKKGFFQSMLGGPQEEHDLDAVAVLLDDTGRIRTLGDQRLVGGDIIFFNHLLHASGDIWLTGDNRTGAGEGDDEQIVVRLDRLSPKYHKVLFMVSIYEGQARRQHFGQIASAYIRAVDASGKELARFSLSADKSLENMCTMVFAEVYRHDGDWKFRALGEAHQDDTFVPLVRKLA